ncbi:surface lipoprotein assembly modifier [Pacificoceanicola onchidii]|uniref:surface lipoprotein assembly modifier n=1 Tax=Pacificoceanicola onchidii TaxID=2562685 RepID=UPI0010A32AFE|nr:surface lipoprotein assembly modifier [Pacificoceanicola onchidii]
MHGLGRLWRALRVAGLCLGVAAIAGAPVVPRAALAEARVSLEEARDMAGQLLQYKRPQEALLLAEGILQGAPEDIPALVLKSRALRDLGRLDEANAVAAEARALAGTDKDRFFAALVTAQAQASSGNKGFAQYWLRRAAQVAPDDRTRALAVRDFRHVRSTTPWRLKLNFYAQPSDNLNGAPKTNAFTFAGLTFENPAAVPLSGMRYGGDVAFTYRFALSEHSRVNLGASAGIERVRFSKSARDTVPGIDNADYSRDRLGFSLGYERKSADKAWLGSAKLSVSRYWGGGQHISDAARLDLGIARRLAEGWTGRLQLGIEDETRHDSRQRSAQTQEATVTLTRHLDKAAISLQLSAADVASDSRLVERSSQMAAVKYSVTRPVAGMLPSLTLSYAVDDYAEAPFGWWVDPRRDEEWGLSLDVLLPKMDYMGFAPEIGVSFRDRSSNYSLYETQSTDLRLGLKSVF